MRTAIAGIGVSLCLLPTVHAQDLAGKYVGSFDFPGPYGDARIGLTLVIQSVEQGKVRAKATVDGRACAGDYVMQGTSRRSELRLRSTSGPRADCGLGLSLTRQDSGLVGTTGGGHKVKLKKR